MKKGLYLFVIALFFIQGILSSCAKTRNVRSFHFTRFSMDTVIEYTLKTNEESVALDAIRKAQDEIDRISSLFWEDDTGSITWKINRQTDSLFIPVEVAECLKRALGYCQITNGYFDITIKPVLNLYDFTSNSAVPPSEEMIRKNLNFVDYTNISLIEKESGNYLLRKRYPEVQIAVGGFVKGYAVDRAVQVLKRRGIHGGIVNAGGDLYCWGGIGNSSWKVGIQHPRRSGEIIRILQIREGAIATSGDYERFFEYKGKRYHHLLNPKTGKPSGRCISATVISNSAEKADALATALFIGGYPEGITLLESIPEAEGMVIDSTLKINTTAGFRKFIIETK